MQRSALTGRRFGRLVAIEDVGTNGSHRLWRCQCDCGAERIIQAGNLTRGQQSCGCHVRTHGLSRSRTYKSWQMMRQRCGNPANDNYKRYGAKGITVCARWQSFDAFLADMGERPPDTSLDRRDNRGHYEPGNCQWATCYQQNANTGRAAGFRTLDDEPISVRAMADVLAVPETFLHWRLIGRDVRLAR